MASITLALIGVSALAVLLLRALNHMGAAPTARLRKLATLSLDRQARLHLVQADDRYFVLGVANGSVSLLTELDREGGAASEEYDAGLPSAIASLTNETPCRRAV